MRIIVLAAASSLLTAGPALAEMSAEEMRAEAIGSPLKFETEAGGSGWAMYLPGGMATMWGANFSPRADTGSWRMEGNNLCVSWRVINNGAENCFTWQRTGNKNFLTSAGIRITKM